MRPSAASQIWFRQSDTCVLLSAANIGRDKDSEHRQRLAIERFASGPSYRRLPPSWQRAGMTIDRMSEALQSVCDTLSLKAVDGAATRLVARRSPRAILNVACAMLLCSEQ